MNTTAEIIRVGAARTPEEAYNEGYDARCEDIPHGKNPYELGDDRRMAWFDGHNDAVDEAENG